MFGSTIIEVGIGLVFVYFLLSVICSNVNNAVAGILGWRSKNLEQAIRTLLGDPNLAENVWQHPLVRGIVGKSGKNPTHIPANTFALTLFDALVPASGNPTALTSVRQTVMNLPENSARQALLTMIDAANGNIMDARTHVEHWFDAAMDRVSATYKQQMLILSLIVAIIVTGVLGVDTIAIANTLYREPAVRAAVTSAAQTNQIAAQQQQNVKANVQDTVQALAQISIPIGWGDPPRDGTGWFQKIVGVLLTALAASLGSPFWYDLLRNLTSFTAKK